MVRAVVAGAAIFGLRRSARYATRCNTLARAGSVAVRAVPVAFRAATAETAVVAMAVVATAVALVAVAMVAGMLAAMEMAVATAAGRVATAAAAAALEAAEKDRAGWVGPTNCLGLGWFVRWSGR